MLKKYKLGLDVGGLALFLMIMLPNFIWFALPAPEDILRAESKTPLLDAAASVCQVCLAAALCAVQNRSRRKPGWPLLSLTGTCVLLYYASWLAYYKGITLPLVVAGLTFPPCLAFLFYAISGRNIPALVPASLFTVLHGVHSIVNFWL